MVTVIPIIVVRLGTVPKGLEKTEGRENQRKNRDHTDHIITEIGLNTEKCPGLPKETCCHSNSSKKASANVGVKNSLKSEILKQM